MSTSAHDIFTRHRLTVNDYHRMSDAGILIESSRVELIEGEVIDMTPVGSQHAGIVSHLSKLLTMAVDASAIVWVQNPVILGNYSEPQPDIALLLPRTDFYKSSTSESRRHAARR